MQPWASPNIIPSIDSSTNPLITLAGADNARFFMKRDDMEPGFRRRWRWTAIDPSMPNFVYISTQASTCFADWSPLGDLAVRVTHGLNLPIAIAFVSPYVMTDNPQRSTTRHTAVNRSDDGGVMFPSRPTSLRPGRTLTHQQFVRSVDDPVSQSIQDHLRRIHQRGDSQTTDARHLERFERRIPLRSSHDSWRIQSSPTLCMRRFGYAVFGEKYDVMSTGPRRGNTCGT